MVAEGWWSKDYDYSTARFGTAGYKDEIRLLRTSNGRFRAHIWKGVEKPRVYFYDAAQNLDEACELAMQDYLKGTTE